MSGQRYLSGDDIADARNAYGLGVPLATLAAQLGVSEDELRRLLGLPEWKRLPAQLELDLWAVDRLADVL